MRVAVILVSVEHIAVINMAAHLKLNNGATIPALGLGTITFNDSPEKIKNAILTALRVLTYLRHRPCIIQFHQPFVLVSRPVCRVLCIHCCSSCL